ncbi:MAG TPA: hypothetical protein VKZ53_08625 [Candidatus Angelobacter sp.]|nr:hypothetical protein [Candidatus Angelobacter sp.]
MIAILAALDLGMALYLLWPGSTSSASLREKERSLETQVTATKKGSISLAGFDERLKLSRGQIGEVYRDRVARRWSDISVELEKLATENGIAKPGVSYTAKDAGLPDLQQVVIETSVSGDYAKVVKFINALERDKFLFVIEQVDLSSKQNGSAQQQLGFVELRIKILTYLKEAA